MPALTLIALVAALLLCSAPAAAHHTASATAELTLEPLSPNCKERERKTRSRCNGSRVASVTWSVSCAYEAIVQIEYLATRPGRGPVDYGMLEIEEPVLSGVARMRIGAGTRVFARTRVFCDYPGDGDSIDAHRVEAVSTDTSVALVAPRLVNVEAVTNSFCGVIPTNRQLSRVLQAGEIAGLDLTLEFDEDSLLGVDSRSKAGRRQMRIVARGPRPRYRRAPTNFVPGATGPIVTSNGARLAPRRGGRLRLWAVIGGVRTNELSMRVLPKRC